MNRYVPFLGLFLLLLAHSGLRAQAYTNFTYDPNLRTVRLHLDGFPVSQPIVELNSGNRLHLSFDDLSNEIQRYRYRIVHCSMNWEPSSLSALEYNTGFEVATILDYDFSYRAQASYVHYDLVLPNADVGWKLSGNYALLVYDEDDEETPVLVRRFMVVDRKVDIAAAVTRAATANKIQTHQEVDFNVNTERFSIRSPLQELRACVLQNGRWDNAIVGVQPAMQRTNEVLFNYQGKIVFPGGNEFRNLDLRSVTAPAAAITFIDRGPERVEIGLEADQRRDTRAYFFYVDVNGDFVNISFDRPVINVTDPFFRENFDRLQLDFTGEYIDTYFRFEASQPYFDQELYLFGAFTNWKLLPEYRLRYNEAERSYTGKFPFKQGFYNYYYVLAEPQKGRADQQPTVIQSETEGDFNETENDYTILVYYRPFGGRFDQLVGLQQINSQR